MEPKVLTNLVGRLRLAEAEHCRQHSLSSSLLGEAADEIERLQKIVGGPCRCGQCDVHFDNAIDLHNHECKAHEPEPNAADEDDCNPFCPTPCPVHGERT